MSSQQIYYIFWFHKLGHCELTETSEVGRPVHDLVSNHAVFLDVGYLFASGCSAYVQQIVKIWHCDDQHDLQLCMFWPTVRSLRVWLRFCKLADGMQEFWTQQVKHLWVMGRIRMRQVLPIIFLVIKCLECMLPNGDEQGVGKGSTSPGSFQAPVLPRVLLEDSAPFDFDGAHRCHHQRNTVELDQQLEKLRLHVVHGNSHAVQKLLEQWSDTGTYVHNLNRSDKDSSEIQCSDLDYLARKQVRYEESIYDHFYEMSYANVSHMTILELALHMTKGSNQRALTMALNKNAMDVGDQGERFQDRTNIIRLLLEKGFLWNSGDLVCQIVPKDQGYRPEVRQAFARAILHDLVRDPIHLNQSRINFLRRSCAGNGMDGVVWILGSAPGAFTLPGFLSHKTVLMNAAEEGPKFLELNIISTPIKRTSTITYINQNYIKHVNIHLLHRKSRPTL